MILKPYIFSNRSNFMKKILAFAAVAVAAVALASADPILVGHGYFGVGIGSTVKNGNGDALDSKLTSWNFGSNLDFGAGLAVNIPFGGYFGFQPGVDFYVNNVGYKFERTINANLWDKHDVTYNYLSLDIPLLLTAKVNKFNFALGPYVSIPLGDLRETWNGSYADAFGEHKYNGNPTTYAHSWGSIGLLIGMGYEQRMGMGRLVIGGNYMLDFIPIDVIRKNSDGTETKMAKLERRALKVDVSYKIPLSF